MNDEIFDVVIIGYGPVGQTTASILGKMGHRVAVFEQFSSLYGLSRAGHFDHEIMRIFQKLEIADELHKLIHIWKAYEWRNSDNELLAFFDMDYTAQSGWSPDFLMYQPDIEDRLDRTARSQKNVSINLSHKVLSISNQDDMVELSVSQTKFQDNKMQLIGDETKVKARYVIGCDGANSLARECIGARWESGDFEEEWLVMDVLSKIPNDQYGGAEGQICDPKRPYCVFPLGHKHRRWEYMLMPGEQAEDFDDEMCWKLLGEHTSPQEVELVRKTVYRFRSASSTSWREGRVMLAGDAAHLMPPFLGQGMCSGVRDAVNVCWKLNLILLGISDDSLLDTYQPERKPQVQAITDLAVELGKVSCTIDPKAAAERDKNMLKQMAEKAVPDKLIFPGYDVGVVDVDENKELRHELNGKLSFQATVSVNGVKKLFDDHFGSSFILVTNQAQHLSAQNQTFLDRIGCSVVQVLASEEDAAGRNVAIDVDCRYQDWFEAHECEAFLMRPDFYLFGAAKTVEDVPALVEALQDKLCLASS